MKTLKKLLLFILIGFALQISGQENTVAPQRTPEQEATKQTEKLQQELNLTPEQSKQIYEINLRYARKRQISNTRSEAMERMKNKNEDIQRVLNESQYNQLQNKRYERTTIEVPSGTRTQSGTPSPTYRSTPEPSGSRTVRAPSSDSNLRSNYRQVTPDNSTRTRPTTPATRESSPNTLERRQQVTPPTRQSYTTPGRTPQLNNSPSPSRSAGTTEAPARKTETPASSPTRR